MGEVLYPRHDKQVQLQVLQYLDELDEEDRARYSGKPLRLERSMVMVSFIRFCDHKGHETVRVSDSNLPLMFYFQQLVPMEGRRNPSVQSYFHITDEQRKALLDYMGEVAMRPPASRSQHFPDSARNAERVEIFWDV